jgi:hypothetical protein
MACATSHAVPKSGISHGVMSHGIMTMTVPGATGKNAADPTPAVDVRNGGWITLHASRRPLSRKPFALDKSLSPEAVFESSESGDATSHG